MIIKISQTSNNRTDLSFKKPPRIAIKIEKRMIINNTNRIENRIILVMMKIMREIHIIMRDFREAEAEQEEIIGEEAED
jgi:hypothetical protein